MDANDRRIDHSNVPVVGFCDHVHQAVPHAGLPPVIEAIVDGRWRPITLRQVGPPSSRPQYPKNAVQYPAIIDPRHTARLIRQTRLDRLPLGIRQLIAAHRKTPVWELESRLARAGNPRTRFMSLRPSSGNPRAACGGKDRHYTFTFRLPHCVHTNRGCLGTSTKYHVIPELQFLDGFARSYLD